MKNIYSYIIIASVLLLFSCDPREGETVESAYFELPIEYYKYKFLRNGISSVDILERDLVDIPMDYIYTSYLKQARIVEEDDYTTVMKYYKEDLGGGIILEDQIASSDLNQSNREKIKQDVLDIILESAQLSGYGSAESNRRKVAKPGMSGYIGENISDPNLAYVNEKGIVIAEVFNKMILGSVYLDKILNKHLDEGVLDNEQLREQHENLRLLPGKNYTELEHHWDLAYGYYTRWKPFTQPEGIIALKDSDARIVKAFILGRYELGRYRYEDMKIHLKIIREELSKVVAIRTMSSLVGLNTLANLKEEATYSFPYLSEAYGLIYALQFTRKADGSPYFTYEQVADLQNKLIQGNGLWDVERLLSDVEVSGSLKNIAKEVGQPYGISLESIKR